MIFLCEDREKHLVVKQLGSENGLLGRMIMPPGVSGHRLSWTEKEINEG